MKQILFSLALAVGLTACSSHKDVATDAAATQPTVPYTLVNNYFLKNNVEGFSNPVIDNQRDFTALFGAATTMGTDGQPTAIDFDREYVVAVNLPTTNVATEIEPVALLEGEKSLTFQYRVKRGEKQSFSTRPLLLLKVARSYGKEVILEDVTNANATKEKKTVSVRSNKQSRQR